MTPKPLWKSTYSLPSTSQTCAPSPCDRYVGRGSAAWNELGTPRGMTATARSNAACEAGVRALSAARSRSVSSRTRRRSMAAEVVAMRGEYGRRRSAAEGCDAVANRGAGTAPERRSARGVRARERAGAAATDLGRADAESARLPRPAGHGRKDDQRVARADRRVEPVEHADVLVVEV